MLSRTNNGQTDQGCEQDRAGCSVNRPTSPREITLFWARRDDIMTDGGEDVGTDGRKCYLTVAPNGPRQTNKHTCTHLTYIEEVDTTSSLKSGWPAPHEPLGVSLQNLWGLSGKQKTAISFKQRRTETESGSGGGFVLHASAPSIVHGLFSVHDWTQHYYRDGRLTWTHVYWKLLQTVIENLFVQVFCYHKAQSFQSKSYYLWMKTHFSSFFTNYFFWHIRWREKTIHQQDLLCWMTFLTSYACWVMVFHY